MRVLHGTPGLGGAHRSSLQPGTTWATALRQSVVEALYEPWFYLPVALLSFEALAVMLALQVNITYMF